MKIPDYEGKHSPEAAAKELAEVLGFMPRRVSLRHVPTGALVEFCYEDDGEWRQNRHCSSAGPHARAKAMLDKGEF